MLFRRIAQHVKEQNWTAVCIDFLIVVIGVFVGIQVSNWNNAQFEYRAERALQDNILADMIELETEFNAIIGRYSETMAASEELLPLLRSGIPPSDPDRIKYLVWRVGYYHDFPAIPSSYTELVSAGGLSRLSSTELRRALIDFGDHYSRFERHAQVAKAALLDPKSAHAAATEYSASPADWAASDTAIVGYDWKKLVVAASELQVWQAHQSEAAQSAKDIHVAILRILSELEDR